MADDVVIRAEGLGKKYLIGHSAERERYVALRDVLARGARGAWRKARDLARGRALLAGDTVEEFWALRDVGFEVRRGEVLGIIGRNGAGKSTLLKILSRITEPSEGRVSIRGRVASLLEVGTGFHPELTGRENIYLNGAVLGMTRAEIRQKFDEIVAFAEVEKFLDTPVKRYSSGMYVRLAFAVAAHLEPEILIVDEVLAVGDAEFQKKCLGKMDEVSRRGGRTVLFVSHNMQAVTSLCQRGIVLDNGTKLIDAEVAAAVRKYVSLIGAGVSARWMRRSSRRGAAACFNEISVEVTGSQPAITLSCWLNISISAAASPSLLAVDVRDSLGVPLMQALPSAEPFLPGAAGDYEYHLEISLPPMVPATYWLTFWIGPAHTETYDWVENAVAFDIVDSPTPGRTFPHTANHGHVVPASRCTLIETTSLDRALSLTAPPT